jgi:hypothetical protein
MLRVSNLAKVNDGLENWLEAIEDLADGAYRGLAVGAFRYIVENTAEWSGNLAASWKLTVGAPAAGYDPTVFKGTSLGGLGQPEPFSKRAPNTAALHYAKSIAKSELPHIRLGAPVYISNGAPYTWNVELNVSERGKAFLRIVNLPVEMVYAASDKFGSLGRLSEAQAKTLAQDTL